MEGRILIDSGNFRLSLPNEIDRSETDSGIDSLPIDADARSSAHSLSSSNKPKRRVQFQSEENLVLIKEIPPRGFYSSDVSDSYSDDEVNEDDNGKASDPDVDDDSEESGVSESTSDTEDEADDKQPSKVSVIGNGLVKRAVYGVGNHIHKPHVTKDRPTITTPPSNNTQKKKPININNSERKTRLLMRRQRPASANRCTSYVFDGKKRKSAAVKYSNVLKSTSSSRNKEIKLRPQTAHPSINKSCQTNYQIGRSTKPLNKITITSPLTHITNPTTSCDTSDYNMSNQTFRNFNISGHVYKMNSFIFPNDQMKTSDYLPNIGDNTRLDFQPRHKQYNAWQVANGNMDSKLFQTPCIAPLWDNVPSSVGKYKSNS